MKILAIDIGFIATGLAIFDNGNLMALHCVESPPILKKRGIYKAHEDAQRVAHMANGIVDCIRKEHVEAIVCEVPHGGAQSGRAMRAMGLATGMIVAIVEVLGLPVEWYLPDQTRIAACGSRKASKDQVVQAMLKLYPDLDGMKTKVQKEACADALATYEAAKSGNLVRLSGSQK